MWQRALAEPPSQRGFEAAVVAKVHAVMDKASIKIETVFAEWNASKDGR